MQDCPPCDEGDLRRAVGVLRQDPSGRGGAPSATKFEDYTEYTYLGVNLSGHAGCNQKPLPLKSMSVAKSNWSTGFGSFG